MLAVSRWLVAGLFVVVGLGTLGTRPADAGGFTVEKSKDGKSVTVKYDGKLLTRYLVKSGAKPILYPLIGPHGNAITRSYPIEPEGKPGERKDHIHHRSFWFTHGDVNGVSFWHEQGGNGNIEHREFLKVSGGDQAVIATRNDWVAGSDKVLCEDHRKLTFGRRGDDTWIDCDIKVIAKDDIKFGDTKEGCFGIRVAGTMKVDAKQGGRIVNSEGQTDRAAWGKPAAWVDYHGPVDGKTVGVTIMNHPSSFRFPTYWHVRTYGLFAANPFGLHNFIGKDSDGSHKMKAGDTFTLRYRVLLHKGDEKEGKVAEAFADYVKTAKR